MPKIFFVRNPQFCLKFFWAIIVGRKYKWRPKNSGDMFLHQFCFTSLFYTVVFLHQFFTPKFCFFTPKFCFFTPIFSTNFFTPFFYTKIVAFLHKNFCFFTPKLLLFYTKTFVFLPQNFYFGLDIKNFVFIPIFSHQILKFRKRFFGKN